MQKYQNIKTFSKRLCLNWYEKVFVITKVKNNLLWAYVISDLKGKEFFAIFYKKKYKDQIKEILELKK